jgi:homoserine O-acetyltransferase/O-succinyltransferase
MNDWLPFGDAICHSNLIIRWQNSCVPALAATSAQLLFFILGDFKLESGQTLEKAQIGYRTFGQLNQAKDNVILIPSWFNGKSADLEAYIGPGNLIDPTGYHIVVVDAISNGVSTSPSNSETQRGEKFPRITIRDMVESQYRLLQHLGIKHVHAVVGISMGGMQAFQWVVQYPSFVSKAIPIVGTPRMGVKDVLLWTTYAKMIPGLGQPRRTNPLIDLFRIGGRTPARNNVEESQFSDLMNGLDPAPAGANNIALPKSPNDVRRQFEAVLAHNITRNFSSSFENTVKALKADLLVVVATQDKVVSPETPLEFAEIAKARKFVLAGECGHNAYKCEKTALGKVLNEFLRLPASIKP